MDSFRYVIQITAACCWLLWSPFLGQIEAAIVIALAAVIGISGLLARLGTWHVIMTITAIICGIGGWRIADGQFIAIIPMFTALPMMAMLWHLFNGLASRDATGFWRPRPTAITALGAGISAALAVTSLMLLSLQHSHRVQYGLLGVWMLVSFWPSVYGVHKVFQPPTSDQSHAALPGNLRAALRAQSQGALFGIMVLPWCILILALLFDIVTDDPYRNLLRMPDAPPWIPFYVRVLPIIFCLSGFFSLRLLHFMINVPSRDWSAQESEEKL
jgi:hypothetical protein